MSEYRRSSMHKSKSTRRRRIYDLLRHIPTFTIRFLRLLLFVAFLLPAFIVFLWHYVTCDRIAAYYGTQCEVDGSSCNDPFFSRHYLDIYGSKTASCKQQSSLSDNKKPVVIFLTGGAWIIGFRMWGTLLARALVPFGVLVIIPDYRNFPRVNIDGMVQDVDMSIEWTFDNVEKYGGDSKKIVLVGQSAGAHIGGVIVAMKVLDWLRKEQREIESKSGNVVQNKKEVEMMPTMLKSTYTPQQLCGFISTSSPTNLVTMRPVFHHHGLSASVQRSIFGGVNDDQNSTTENSGNNGDDVFKVWSPYHLVMKSHETFVSLLEMKDGSSKNLELKGIFPRLCIIHGTEDKTVPVREAIEFISLLAKVHIPTETKMYKDWTHTDPILEAPMKGNHLYHKDIFQLVSFWTDNVQSHHTTTFDEKHPILLPICPSVLVEAARFCNPF